MSTTTAPGFPFSAVYDQERLQLALILTAIAPRIGGVVIRGEKGTAKTTTVRGFQSILGGAPLVNLPIGATEDRVVGALDLETVLTTGKANYRPGLLAEADGGILYVDEVNLLADHLVDALLDAAATGRVTIERDGISHTSPANFILVGTMNPEEGELRPQLLDRFGLSIDVSASRDVATRTEIMRRRLAFEDDPQGFADDWSASDDTLSQRVAQAKHIISQVVLSDENLARIAQICAAFDVDGMRGDLVIARTARAHAAWSGRSEVLDEDIRIAAELALPHRRRRNPFDEPGLDSEQLDEAMNEPLPQNGSPTDPPTENDSSPKDSPAESEPTSDGEVGSADTGAPFRS
ncbi:magnesium chelatase subunit D [Corynebacterium kutscheri]|uniref:Magnesium chelatase subunit D n=1 Tax=Corynebacterium kutscheri TaxID=35755 RepID=A0A0F6TD56_9CORY|nr:AAA family ATPase [Corynebacterium kutscheri]AKE41454.1 Mg-chelatase subunit ChlI [Corynebacterium kutscheri]VEH08732.1 magnesium chelatase subunit D [Corynebacterium kutscheri]VEH09778.1 magnesium chelatase subunit D [Corynebacterium kutscheri]VEH79861.1 magnesium chelatase subunit D [Corynebacterium kutscheri]